jgi:hypothetical protein
MARVDNFSLDPHGHGVGRLHVTLERSVQLGHTEDARLVARALWDHFALGNVREQRTRIVQRSTCRHGDDGSGAGLGAGVEASAGAEAEGAADGAFCGVPALACMLAWQPIRLATMTVSTAARASTAGVRAERWERAMRGRIAKAPPGG